MHDRNRVIELMNAAQAELVAAFEAIDGETPFGSHEWQRPGGGGGRARVLEEGRVFERAGVNVSAVHGSEVPPSLAKQHPGTEGRPFFATGISLVLHPRNPYVPAFHANYRYFEIAGGELWWFGGGADMTPNYGFEEDAIHFHATLKGLCDRHEQADYAALKRRCDEYFFVKHRNEMRGIGGIFFDQLSPAESGSWEADFAFVVDGTKTILPSYRPIVSRRMHAPFGERERQWQLYRRGRYVEFNLVYDRGTLFGLQTGGNIEAILMSLPPYPHWRFNYIPAAGTPEAASLEFLKPRDWVSASATNARGH